MTDNTVISFPGTTRLKINPIRMLEAIIEDLGEQDDVIVIVRPHNKEKRVTYHMSDPATEKAVLDLECFKFALVRELFP